MRSTTPAAAVENVGGIVSQVQMRRGQWRRMGLPSKAWGEFYLLVREAATGWTRVWVESTGNRLAIEVGDGLKFDEIGQGEDPVEAAQRLIRREVTCGR